MDVNEVMTVPVLPNPIYRREEEKLMEKAFLNMQGHKYVRLIKVVKKRAFWLLCEWCRVACNGVISMGCHLARRKHAENIYETKKRLPYPFNDGKLLCFYESGPPELVNGQLLGHSIIGARYHLKEEDHFITTFVEKIWCEWTGANSDRTSWIDDHDFSVVVNENDTKRRCHICKLYILPTKDCGTLMNTTTERYACNSRNVNGVRHRYNIWCLVQWILLCESESISVFCPQCQIPGINGHELNPEPPTVDMGQIEQYLDKLALACQRWRRCPILLRTPDMPFNGMIGLYFTGKLGDQPADQRYVSKIKSLPFCRAVA